MSNRRRRNCAEMMESDFPREQPDLSNNLLSGQDLNLKRKIEQKMIMLNLSKMFELGQLSDQQKHQAFKKKLRKFPSIQQLNCFA